MRIKLLIFPLAISMLFFSTSLVLGQEEEKMTQSEHELRAKIAEENKEDELKTRKEADADNIADLKQERRKTKQNAKDAQRVQRDATSAARESRNAYRSEKKAQSQRKRADAQAKKAQKARDRSDKN